MEILFSCVSIILFCSILLIMLLQYEFNAFSNKYYYDLLVLLLVIFLLWGLLFIVLPI